MYHEREPDLMFGQAQHSAQQLHADRKVAAACGPLRHTLSFVKTSGAVVCAKRLREDTPEPVFSGGECFGHRGCSAF
eukprot:6206226-Pleurochrysis_carterae.AAC.4